MWKEPGKNNVNWKEADDNNNYIIKNMPNVSIKNYLNVTISGMSLFVSENKASLIWLEG